MPPLPIETVRRIARHHGYEEVQFNESSRVVAFRSADGSCRINVYYTTGTVATSLDHPRSGKTQLFRRNMTEDDLAAIFRDPRTHTGAGYYRRKAGESWEPATFGGRAAECDDARRWRYVQAATGFCNESQAGQIAAFCKLWDQLRFMPGGMTSREHYERTFSDILGPRNFCSDSHEARCSCSERAGSWCALSKVLLDVAYRTDNVIVLYRSNDEVEGNDGGDMMEHDNCDSETRRRRPDFIGAGDILGCNCEEGVVFQSMYGQMLEKLKRQLMSFSKYVRRELIVWFIAKHVNGYCPLYLDSSGEPKPLGGDFCSNDVLACQHDYGKLVYGPGEPNKGCNCHGV